MYSPACDLVNRPTECSIIISNWSSPLQNFRDWFMFLKIFIVLII